MQSLLFVGIFLLSAAQPVRSGYLGCFKYYFSPTLNGKSTSSNSMTLEMCRFICQWENVLFYGTEDSDTCFCGNALLPSIKKPDNECNAKCSGNKKQFCGGKKMISVYKNINFGKGYLGCFGSFFSDKSFMHPKMTVELCRKFCEKRNAQYYGLQYGKKCSCGDNTPVNRKMERECGDTCTGNKDQYCGGYFTQSTFVNRNYDNGYLGCFQDDPDSTLNVNITSSKVMTVVMCREFCQKEDVPFYSLQAGSKCFCRSSPLPSVKKSDGDCRVKCSGNGKEFCGGKTMISIHKNSYYEKGYLGCFRSAKTGKAFIHNEMTVELCRKFCEKRNAKYYGLQYGKMCNCGDNTPVNRKIERECGDTCTGNKDQYCGGYFTQSTYVNRKYDNGYMGCFQDDPDLTLNMKSISSRSMTVVMCREFCQREDVPFYALQAGSKCFCTNSPLPSVKKANGDCRIKCSGNKKEYCGGKTMTSIHKNSYYEKGYLGCFRVGLTGKSFSHHTMTAELCRKFCEKQNSKYFGLQYGKKCSCGDSTPVNRKIERECDDTCTGNKDQYCGGYFTQSTYVNRKYDNGYLGCFQDESESTLNAKETSSKSMTVVMCKELCQKEDVPFYGLQAGSKCFCRSSPLPSVKKSDGDCRVKCSGNEKEFCGGKIMISIHKNSYYEKDYLGCFRSAFNGKSFMHHRMTAELCRKFCEKQNTKYYGLQYGKMCKCGNTTPANRQTENACYDTCTGNKDQYCGGYFTQSTFVNRNYNNDAI